MRLQLPKGFLLGASSAAAQIEGGEVGSSWNDWYHRGKIKDGSDPATADDHWNRWREDCALMAGLHLPIARIGVEWARIMPARGVVNEAAIERYRAELRYLKKLGVQPLLTIHHFSNPMWFEKMGAFTKRENLGEFLAFARLCAERFGDLVSDWITINEPNVYALNGYFYGTWPPGHKHFSETFTVMENLAYCHIQCYTMLHETRTRMGFSDTKVGFANHLRVFEPENAKSSVQSAIAKTVAWLFQGAISEAMTTGVFRLPLHNHWKLPAGEYCDFHGVNYYSRSTISGFADGVRKNSPRNDLGWEIYPEGIAQCAALLDRLLKRPIWVTENGTCDQHDTFRARYIYEHLKVIVQSGLPFERYYHWCFCDNFEWLEGESARFGLVNVDYATQTRTIKRSGTFYADIIENGGVTEEAYNCYVRGEVYRVE